MILGFGWLPHLHQLFELSLINNSGGNSNTIDVPKLEREILPNCHEVNRSLSGCTQRYCPARSICAYQFKGSEWSQAFSIKSE